VIKLIVTVCALVGAQAGECVTEETEVDSMQMCVLAEALTLAASKRQEPPQATYEIQCVVMQ
jgi:hypothetical protein